MELLPSAAVVVEYASAAGKGPSTELSAVIAAPEMAAFVSSKTTFAPSVAEDGLAERNKQAEAICDAMYFC
jgi:hypothetical protein